ncbi:hypothetical protein BaRGS_00040216 [Batillaria attramentaria]|uniref:Uncharacterized protein n=1 Tax=Batillaria attramentaria TaxID=370345 RepID=A0ABD0J1H3_9CAEN
MTSLLKHQRLPQQKERDPVTRVLWKGRELCGNTGKGRGLYGNISSSQKFTSSVIIVPIVHGTDFHTASAPDCAPEFERSQ